jgi:hypothetical protein
MEFPMGRELCSSNDALLSSERKVAPSRTFVHPIAEVAAEAMLYWIGAHGLHPNKCMGLGVSIRPVQRYLQHLPNVL